MNNIQNNLQKDEAIVSTAKLHWVVFVPSVLALVIAVSMLINGGSPILLVAPVLLFVPAFFNYISTSIVLTNKRLIGKVGIIKTSSLDTPVHKINNSAVHANLFGNILGYGTLVITSSSGTYNFAKIAKPNAFSQKVMAEIENYSDAKTEKGADAHAQALAGVLNK